MKTSRRSFLKTMFGTAAAVATGGLGKVAEALTTKPAVGKVMHGFKGSAFLEAGYFFAPYIPLQTVPTVLDPKDFIPNKDILTRYGKTQVRHEYYGSVTIRDLTILERVKGWFSRKPKQIF